VGQTASVALKTVMLSVLAYLVTWEPHLLANRSASSVRNVLIPGRVSTKSALILASELAVSMLVVKLGTIVQFVLVLLV